MTYAQILAHVFESGRITISSQDNYEGFLAEVEVEVEFEATERAESGELEGTIEGAVKFALSHVG